MNMQFRSIHELRPDASVAPDAFARTAIGGERPTIAEAFSVSGIGSNDASQHLLPIAEPLALPQAESVRFADPCSDDSSSPPSNPGKSGDSPTGPTSSSKGHLDKWLSALLGPSNVAETRDTLRTVLETDGNWGNKALALLRCAHSDVCRAASGAGGGDAEDDDGALPFSAFCETACTHLVAALLADARREPPPETRQAPLAKSVSRLPTAVDGVGRHGVKHHVLREQLVVSRQRNVNMTPRLWQARKSLHRPSQAVTGAAAGNPLADSADMLPPVETPLMPLSAKPMIEFEAGFQRAGDDCDDMPKSADALSAASPAGARLESPKFTMEATYVEDCDDGTTELNQYVLLDPLGKGSQGEVFLAMDTEKNELRAVKAVPRPGGVSLTPSRGEHAAAVGRPLNAARRRQREQLEREVAIMKRCRHRNVVALYEVIDDPEQERMYLVMQYVEHGPIASVGADGGVSRTVEPVQLARFARQLAAGLEYLHRRGIIHRDIKPENILLGADEQVYLADFGTAEVFEGGARAAVEGTRGTLAFVAPELLEDRGPCVVVSPAALGASPSPLGSACSGARVVDGEAVDVWALGVTLYALLYGELPFFADDARELFASITHSEPDFSPTASNSATTTDTAAPRAFGSEPRRQDVSASFTMSPSFLSTSEEFTSDSCDATGAGIAAAAWQRWTALLRRMLQKDPVSRATLRDVRSELASITRLEKRSPAAPTAGSVFTALAPRRT